MTFLNYPGTLLVPADDWRRPLLTDNAQSIRIAQDPTIFPVVYGTDRGNNHIFINSNMITLKTRNIEILDDQSLN